MIHGKVPLRALSRALVVSSFALSAACDMRSSAPQSPPLPATNGVHNTAGPSVPDPPMPVVVVTAHRPGPADLSARRTAQARYSQSRDTKRRGG